MSKEKGESCKDLASRAYRLAWKLVKDPRNNDLPQSDQDMIDMWVDGLTGKWLFEAGTRGSIQDMLDWDQDAAEETVRKEISRMEEIQTSWKHQDG